MLSCTYRPSFQSGKQFLGQRLGYTTMAIIIRPKTGLKTISTMQKGTVFPFQFS